MAATLTLLPPIADQDTPSPEEAEGITRVAKVMHAQGITPSRLTGCPSLAKYVPPLEALIAARATRYAEAARIFLASGIPSAFMRERAMTDPEFAYLYLGVADAMDALAATG